MHCMMTISVALTKISLKSPWFVYKFTQYRVYYNRFDQRIARQQLCKHSSTCDNRGGCVFFVRGNVTQWWMVVTWRVSCDLYPFLGYISDRIHSVQGRCQFSVGDSDGMDMHHRKQMLRDHHPPVCVTLPGTQKRWPLLLCVGPCLHSCCLATCWSNLLHYDKSEKKSYQFPSVIIDTFKHSDIVFHYKNEIFA
jgi:hypothetical protein